MSQKTYRIGEAAEMLGLKTYVLRFWETEFPQISPLRTGKGQRLYTDEHMETLRLIQRLLHEEGMTIEGARRILSGQGRQEAPVQQLVVTDGAIGAVSLLNADAYEGKEGMGTGTSPETFVLEKHRRLFVRLREELVFIRNLLIGR